MAGDDDDNDDEGVYCAERDGNVLLNKWSSQVVTELSRGGGGGANEEIDLL